ncbi:TPA: hypothetical protein IAA68_08105 [Candidatus Galligastranaerophilus faecipullorum]|nr:hypothetical protein [Candidatus Galligastranaerophilus faecipullorum]
MKMHNYISLNLFSASSYAALAALPFALMRYEEDIAYAKANNLDVDIWRMTSSIYILAVYLEFFLACIFFFICFLIELFVRVKFKKEGFCIRFKSEIFRIIHVVLFYIGIALAPFINPFWRIM